MRYSNTDSSAGYGYPDHNVPPEEKGKNWCMQYAKAAYNDWSFAFPRTVFYNNQGKYEKARLYAMGMQPINQYKTWLGIDAQTNDTWLNIDWSVRAVIGKFRDIALARLIQQEYGIVATPIDPLAKTEMEQYYAQMKAKIVVRKMMEQQNPELANHPMLARQPGEPIDMEEMEMRVDLGEQFNRSKDAELAIQLAFYQNDSKLVRKGIFQDLFDFGVAGYKEWLGDDNMPKFRKVDPECVIVSYCKKPDFSDAVHAGEVIDVALVDLATKTDEEGNLLFTEKQLTELAVSVAGKWGNPNSLGVSGTYYKPYDKFKVKAFEIEFYTYNNYYSNSFVNSKGNLVWERKSAPASTQGRRKYQGKRIKYAYKCTWIVNTEYAYDWGMCYDQKRSKDARKKAETTLSYKFIAANFYEMHAQAMMDRLIPLIDDYQMTVYKIQNFKNRAVPSGWWIDLDALENVALNKGGKNMSPKQLLQMFFETGVLVGRSTDIANNNVNYKPIIPIENTAASELAMFYQDMQNTLAQMQSIIGLNEITDASTPNPKTLVPGYENANISTNNALFSIADAEKNLIERLAADVMCRTQQGVKKGDVYGYAPALNSNVLQFIRVSPALSLREYGIMLEEKSTDEQKQMLLMNMQQDKASGFLDTSDEIHILNTYNIKQAQMIMAYRVKKAKEQMQAYELQKIQLNNQGASEAAQVASQLAQQKLQLEWALKTQYMEREYELKGMLVERELQVKDNMNTTMVHGKILTQQAANEGKLQQESLKQIHEALKEPTAA